MSKRGLSMEEKKVKMMEIFNESADFWAFKDLERQAPKLKGIVSQSVKEVIDDLVGDNLLQTDKIGTGIYFWSFPSAAGAKKQNALAKAEAELESVKAKIGESRAGLIDADKGREDTPDRRKLLSTLTSFHETSYSLKSELASFTLADPIRYERKQKAVEVCKEAAVRWTDNVLILMQFMKTATGCEEEQLRAMLGIDEGWEDVVF